MINRFNLRTFFANKIFKCFELQSILCITAVVPHTPIASFWGYNSLYLRGECKKETTWTNERNQVASVKVRIIVSTSAPDSTLSSQKFKWIRESIFRRNTSSTSRMTFKSTLKCTGRWSEDNAVLVNKSQTSWKPLIKTKSRVDGLWWDIRGIRVVVGRKWTEKRPPHVKEHYRPGWLWSSPKMCVWNWNHLKWKSYFGKSWGNFYWLI
jgi:hypothetical protein